jgi:membrane protein YdbS with pleckstrin-like domain
MDSALVFRSKVDTFLLVTLMSAVVACAYGAYALIQAVPQLGVLVSGVLIGLCAIGVAMPLWVLFSTRYLLGDNELDVRSGPFRWTVPIKEITAIDAARGLLSSPALSLDRLRIRYSAERELMISPENRKAFLLHLEARRKS